MNAPTDSGASGSMRLVLTLAIAGLVSGIAIIGIYESTLPTITANKARELREAVFKVLPGVSQMQALVYRDGELVAVDRPDKDEPVVYGGYDEHSAFVGYAMPGAGPGFQDTIALLYGYRPDEKNVVGMEILESRETPGLGDKIYKDAVFVSGFSALSVEPEIVAVKKGTKSRPNEIDAITGATISSKAVVRIINETHADWSAQLPEPGSEPRLEATETAGTEADQ
ncbi:MAG: FMN-binding protein [Gammaproteobacteria bacterium]|nr:FMN-binding protein [Gammaproteobacteria bacterium]MDH3429547.1 FMN-binding protein [Gammaproteobacteria bacterium]MDH3432358.1 FMN-binding protein [Gammaproteobacteria bacterium]